MLIHIYINHIINQFIHIYYYKRILLYINNNYNIDNKKNKSSPENKSTEKIKEMKNIKSKKEKIIKRTFRKIQNKKKSNYSNKSKRREK